MSTRKAPFIPKCWLLCDARLGDNIPAIIAAMPPRCAVIVRPYAMGKDRSAAMIRSIRRTARAKRHLLLLGGKGSIAGFDGRHGSPHLPQQPKLLSIAVHNEREARAARQMKADAILISPIWPTRSHPQARGIGIAQFQRLARLCGCAAIALGGMNAARFRGARRHGAHGWAAIDAWQGIENKPEK
ncbi:MAG: thiamine phosphate synthase [Sphingopyxis sp.]